MKKGDSYIKYVEGWYSFYKSIDTNTSKNKWLIDLTIDFYEETLSYLYSKRQNKEMENSILDLQELDIPQQYQSSVKYPTSNNFL